MKKLGSSGKGREGEPLICSWSRLLYEKKSLFLVPTFWSIRNVMVVSRIGITELKTKLFCKPFRFWGVGATFGVTVRKFRTFCATALNGVLILFPGNGERQVTPLTTRVVEGSKICPTKIGLLLSQGFRVVVAAPSNAEKSPVSSAGVGSVVSEVKP